MTNRDAAIDEDMRLMPLSTLFFLCGLCGLHGLVQLLSDAWLPQAEHGESVPHFVMRVLGL